VLLEESSGQNRSGTQRYGTVNLLIRNWLIYPGCSQPRNSNILTIWRYTRKCDNKEVSGNAQLNRDSQMNIHTVYGLFLPLFRRKRMKRFVATFNPTSSTRILDVGGGVFNWQLIECTAQITILNLSVPADTSAFPLNFSFVKGNGTCLEHQDNSFDIAYSNSVIEHLSSWENQIRFANEIRRVAKKVWVQTPARWFFVEPHVMTPFIHFLPKQWQRHLLRNFTVWGLITRPSQEFVDQFLDEVRLLTLKEMQTLFPDCIILKERFLLFTKAYITVRN
jgi:hypothetical protein